MRQDDRKMALRIFILLGMLFVLSGCLRRVEVVTRERLDQEVTGNRGVLHGPVPRTPSTASPTRKYMEWDIEVPTYEVGVQVPEWHREWHDKELWGNRGYFTGGPAQKRPSPPGRAMPAREPERPTGFFERPSYHEKAQVMEHPAIPSLVTYTVKKGDTLGGISSKMYGTSKGWRRIYEANTDILKNPNRLSPGQTLRIPEWERKKEISSKGTLK